MSVIVIWLLLLMLPLEQLSDSQTRSALVRSCSCLQLWFVLVGCVGCRVHKVMVNRSNQFTHTMRQEARSDAAFMLFLLLEGLRFEKPFEWKRLGCLIIPWALAFSLFG
mmetsp:Transcript_3000/g.6358  ORF Transcript_3000/g.6358 Transcript_3000/m.6358 type:complete len:109 (-) Transcript_3000:23-349(-)